MTNHLEQLVRDTLQDRAADVDRGPVWSPPSREGRRRWPMAVAAAVTTGVVGVGLFALRAADQPSRPAPSQSNQPAPGAAARSCAATLPAAWRAAAHRPGTTVAGQPASPRFVTDDGRVVVAWQAADKTWHTGLRDLDATTSTLFGLPRDVSLSGFAAEHDTLVFGTPARKGVGPTRSIVVINTSTGARRELLPDPAVPAGYSVVSGVALLDGVVYFGASPRGALDGVGGVVMGYDLATRTARVVGRSAGEVAVSQDIRGVWWAGGHVTAAGTPASLPRAPYGTGTYSIAGDGTAWAWSAVPSGARKLPRDAKLDRTVHWVGADGATRTIRVRLPDNRLGAPEVQAVAGPYVVLSPSAGSPQAVPEREPQLSVLDTRTGAIAELGLPHVDISVANRGVLAVADRTDATVRVDTTRLPGLGC